MIETADNYFFNINWNDLEKNTHRVGFFSIYNEKFYFKIKGKESIERAYDKGFAGMPGVESDKIYVSANQVFDRLKKMLGIVETKEQDIETIKELLSSKIEEDETLENRRDRLSFDKMTEREAEECQREIDELEELANKKNDEGR